MKELMCRKCQGHGEYLYKDEYESIEVKNQSCEMCSGLGFLIRFSQGTNGKKEHGISDRFKSIITAWKKT